MPGDVLSTRELNRALLGRQFLLERAEVPIADAIEHLVGQQAQEPWDPYYGLWSRLRNFDPHELGGMIERLEVVRMGAMRGTIHLMTARDALVLRGAMAPAMKFSQQVQGVDLDELVAIAAELTAEKPHGRTDLSRALSERWPEADFDALGYTAAFCCRSCRRRLARSGGRPRRRNGFMPRKRSARRSNGMPTLGRSYCAT